MAGIDDVLRMVPPRTPAFALEEPLTAREALCEFLNDFAFSPGDKADRLLDYLRRHGFVILPLAKLAALESRLSAMHDAVEAIGPALAELQAEALKD